MSMLARFFLAVIRFYQVTFSTLMGRECRFYPSCSHYASDAIRRYGALRGGWMGARRILRCNPWNQGGYDPVPETLPLRKGFWGKFFSKNASICAKDAHHCSACPAPDVLDAQSGAGHEIKGKIKNEAIRPE